MQASFKGGLLLRARHGEHPALHDRAPDGDIAKLGGVHRKRILGEDGEVCALAGVGKEDPQ